MMKKIMVVDDEPDVTYTVKHGLESLDSQYEVICVGTGESCLELLEKNQIPDLILLDIMLPGMNGWNVFKTIKEHQLWKDIPIVFLTNRSDAMAKDAGSFLGSDFLNKPFKIPELKLRIDRLLKQ
ncbi:MAG: response regulator transcription factor [Candidatus Thermoplasmatota archaeon]|nr:response regulator transcription factor [Candidatus Thermoplasmatota archaeon]